MLVGMATVGDAQDVPLSFGGTQSTTVGTYFSEIGSSSTGASRIEGLGGGAVTVTNKLSVVTLAPVANASSEFTGGKASTEGMIDGPCCATLSVEDSHRESIWLDGRDEQAITHPRPHDELVQLYFGAAQARVAVDLAGLGHDLARAARR